MYSAFDSHEDRMNIGYFTNPIGWKTQWNDETQMAQAEEDLIPRQKKLDSFKHLPTVQVLLFNLPRISYNMWLIHA